MAISTLLLVVLSFVTSLDGDVVLLNILFLFFNKELVLLNIVLVKLVVSNFQIPIGWCLISKL